MAKASLRVAQFEAICGEWKGARALTTAKRPRGRPPKYPPDDVRRRLIDAAIEILHSSGVESGLDAVTLDGAILDADVPRGMSYKIWRVGEGTPQDAFRHATVLDILSIPAVAGLPATREFTSAQLQARASELASDDLNVRRSTVSELIRVVGEFNHVALAESANWRIYTALRTAAVTRSNVDPAIVAALDAGEEYLVEQYADFYTEISEAVGLVLKSEFTMTEFSAAAYSLNEGLSMRLGDSYRRDNIMRSDAGRNEPWTLFAIALEGLVFHFFEWK